MNRNSLSWKIYKLLFLDIWHRFFFNGEIKPQDDNLSGEQLDKYLDNLNIKVIGIKNGEKVNFEKDHPPTLFFANHPSTLDALFTYSLLQKVNPFFVSFIHNQYHFKFLENRIIPVAAFFKANQFSLLGMKMRLAKRLEKLTPSQAREINMSVTDKAVQLLENGKSVVIYPSGGWGEWQDGIGFIIEKYMENNPKKDLHLQPLKAKSFGEIHSVLHGLLHLIGFNVCAEVRIIVGKEYRINDLSKKFSNITDEKAKAKAIRAYLENEYKKI